MARKTRKDSSIARRDFLKTSAASVGAVGAYASVAAPAEPEQAPGKPSGGRPQRPYGGNYSGEYLNRVAFPMGGMGAGMICLEGTGALSHFSLRNKPEVFNEPCTFAAASILGENGSARVLEGPVPKWKIFGAPGTGNGLGGTSFGLPRFSSASFRARFPFASVTLTDSLRVLEVEVTGWSPFEPGDADNSSLPVAALEYRFTNRSEKPQEAVFSFNARNFVAVGRNAQGVRAIPGGFVLWGGGTSEKPYEEGAFAATVDDPKVKVNHAWFRGGWFDALTMVWKDIAEGACYDRPPVAEGEPAPGATLSVPFQLGAGASHTVVLLLAWYAGRTNLRLGKDPAGSQLPVLDQTSPTYQPWYTGRFADVQEVMDYWKAHYRELRGNSERFRDCFYNSTLPAEIIEAVAANLTILKSPTVLRQRDGRLWAWEGCSDNTGCCHGTCTHVWNYAQAIPHLFPALERTLRETEFGPSQDETGHQTFRAALPIRVTEHDFYAAADGQLGGVMKVFRDWRISGDSEWLRHLWPKVKQSLNYCIETWDPQHRGTVEEPHHNTYDIEFWGPDGMCTSFYLGALQAASTMARALGEDVPIYAEILAKGKKLAETELFNGEYFIQRIEWKNLRAKNPLDNKSMVGKYSAEAIALFEKEGPKYQYGNGCLSDGVLGSWLALVCGVGQVLAREKVASHLRSVHRHNLKKDLSSHANPQRPSYACGSEGGLLLCTWPKGGTLSLPFVYSNEVWTGIEYQVASHLMALGFPAEGLEIVRVCRDRYDGRVRNPFNEYECGHWYARAMSSYALLQGMTGARYDALEKILYLEPTFKGDFRSFLATAGAYGTVGVENGKPFFKAAVGQIEIRAIKYRAKA
jgi:uncharacterized protein (DUF608 family)